MRAPETESVGTAGQSYVKAEFEELGWGVSPNLEHDLGTDLWLMARDARRFELKALVGAQVKTGQSYFDQQVVDMEGVTLGWWYRERDDSHFEYWCDHAVPHILLLRDLDLKSSWWVHVTRESLQSTGKGQKIFVPATNLVNRENLDKLLQVATSTLRAVFSLGGGWESIGDAARLRYALVVPRLVAPRPGRISADVHPTQAIAALLQLRLRELAGYKVGELLVDPEAAAASTIWEWRLYAALYAWITRGDAGAFDAVTRAAPSVERRVAVVVCSAFAWFERGEVIKALRILQGEIGADEASPVDHGWLRAHAARCFSEVGRVTEARNVALELQALRNAAPSDPTAHAIAAAAGDTIFALSGSGDETVHNLTHSSDTAAAWWRSQTLASGLSHHFEETFRIWAGHESRHGAYADDATWTRLRSAMLLGGLAADGSSWRDAGWILAGRQLMVGSDDEEAPQWALDVLRLAGGQRELRMAVGRLLEVGPVSSLTKVGQALDLRESTRTSLCADMTFLEAAADVLDSSTSDRHVAWALEVLCDPGSIHERLRPQCNVGNQAIQMLGNLVQSATAEMRIKVMDHLVQLAVLEDQLIARWYGRVLARIPEHEWTDDHVVALLQRDADDNYEFRHAIDTLLASRRASYRQELLGQIESGNLLALQSFGKVTELPPAAVRGMVSSLERAIELQAVEARKGMFGIGGHDYLAALILLNCWHPEEARWSTVEDALAVPESYPDHLVGGIARLGQLADRVPSDVRERLRLPLEAVIDRSQRAATRILMPHADVGSAAELALALLFPDCVAETTVQGLVTGDAGKRSAAVELITARRDATQLTLLALLARDPDLDVRVTVAEGLASWVVRGVEVDGSLRVLRMLLGEGGTRLGIRISRALLDPMAQPGSIEVLGTLLESHPSAVVRARVALTRKSREAG